jgi:hypothetical protein
MREHKHREEEKSGPAEPLTGRSTAKHWGEFAARSRIAKCGFRSES